MYPVPSPARVGAHLPCETACRRGKLAQLCGPFAPAPAHPPSRNSARVYPTPLSSFLALSLAERLPFPRSVSPHKRAEKSLLAPSCLAPAEWPE